MEEIRLFEPLTTDLWLNLALGVAMVFAGAGIMYYALRLPTERDQRLRLLLPYAGLIIGILGFMTASGHGWLLVKYPTIRFQNQQIQIGKGEFEPLPGRSAWRIERDRGVAASWGKAQNILLIEDRDGKGFALPQDRYNLQEIIRELQQE